MVAEPWAGRWIDGLLPVVAENGDRVSLDVSAQAGRTRLILDGEPENGQFADHFADSDFERLLALPIRLRIEIDTREI